MVPMAFGDSQIGSGLSLLGARAVAPNHQPDSVTLKAYEKSGNCFSYEGTANRDKELAPCKVYCAKTKGNDATGYGCLGPGDAAGILHDDDGNDFRPGKCQCDFELAEIITDIVAKGLSQLDSLLCHMLIETFKTIADVGLMFVPGGAAVKGVSTTLKYAKSAFENGMSALNFFDGWVGDVCGNPQWDFSLEGMFMDAVNAPDSMMGSDFSIGCVRKSKSKCKKRDPKPDPKGKTDIHRGTGGGNKPGDNKGPNNNKNTQQPAQPTKPTTMRTQTRPISTKKKSDDHPETDQPPPPPPTTANGPKRTKTQDKPKDPNPTKFWPTKYKCKDNP
ncbi:uncharacterized protein PG998_002727 [Apiospora kogelbergensis]|uniref:uncharacterized protein n=1 Tax=Apiospora kogelbergensis TaxID=1337665 RepID=UPI00312F2F1E